MFRELLWRRESRTAVLAQAHLGGHSERREGEGRVCGEVDAGSLEIQGGGEGGEGGEGGGSGGEVGAAGGTGDAGWGRTGRGGRG